MVPVLPAHSPLMVMLIGFFLAITSSVSAAFVAEYLDPSFRTPEDVVNTLNIPVLASMPRRAA
jgi:capsular polysaccharide biosynthesis protein